ncbi:Holliday junction branch migration DNA helicase RuvB [Candidatus Azambacteria bacterium]|nr:Holliday junction branch migration DNA helicase RuvB [Candidatus Azambacteria bacterium]
MSTLTPLPQEDQSLDLALRPKRWGEFVGQEKIKQNLRVLLEAAKRRKEPPDHLLFCGPSGLGKTTLAYIVAEELGAPLRVTSGPAIERLGDLAAILTNLEPGEVLFIDEVHRLNKLVEELLYPALESRRLDLVIGKGPSARTLRLDLHPFTFIGATTRLSLLSSPLRSRFGATFRLDFYSLDDMQAILERSARILGLQMTAKALLALAQTSRATPRVANRLLKRTRDVAQLAGVKTITPEVIRETLHMLEVDEQGLEAADRRILEAVIEKFGGGPVGIGALAAATQEERDTIEDVYEPYLLQLGFLARTPRGRVATKLAYTHLGKKFRAGQLSL